MRVKCSQWLVGATLPLLALPGCVGGSSPLAMAPTPTPTPTPTPAPVLSPGPAILAAVQTPSPASPVASGASPSFSALGSTTSFPLFQTSIDGSFAGDTATTNAGAVLTVRPDSSAALTINNAGLGVSNVQVGVYPGTSVGLYQVATELRSADLDYTRFGYWLRYQPTEGLWQASAFTGGFVTPVSDIPTSGTASYTGAATGIFNDQAICNCVTGFVSQFNGDVSLTANFAQLTINGSITNISLTSLSYPPGPTNDIGFTATIDRANNLFSGTTSVTSEPGGVYAFGPTASGLINGRFYGPNAAEVGAVFNLTEGTRRLIGSFGAKH